ncbi:MAG TPA: FGGY-family carbohydrate kinase [Bacillota bacterium]|nr:FGGY-family carbohydrate kinase [Bacillota bacterium]HPJ85576.1 FGGY-family carbohydrate kinase [Bacillota bacterium]HPQ61472.1 FGGY-family carbohydrate kinase [Bacillota bacterium]HRX91726.1 FGGY-family carbohydrate kinase [Candidatus Izemoplasmatales bacterium]
MDPLVLTFDFGTQSVRAMLVDKKGKILVIRKEKYDIPYYARKMGYCEQSFDKYWFFACKASLGVKEISGKLWDDIASVTVTTIRDTFTCTDESGKPLRDFIIWLDQRKAKCEKRLPLLQRLLYKLVGMDYAIECQREICRPNWIKENEPELWQKTAKFGNLSALVHARLTGVYKDSSAAMIGHVPFDNKHKQWMKKSNLQFPIFGIEEDKLTELVDPTDLIGYITKIASEETGLKEGLPLFASGSDKGCETLGSGVMDGHSASLSFGTSATIQFSTDKYIEPATFLPAYPAINPKLYNPELQVFRGCWMLSWFIDNFAKDDAKKAYEKGISTEEELNMHLKDVPIGSGGLMLIPYWNAPLKLPEARGAVIGFMPDHDKYYLYRSIIEGIAFTLYSGFVGLKKRTKQDIEYLVISGGGANSLEICQMAADIFGLPVKKTTEYEASGIGSSICGFVGLGVYDNFDDAVKNMVSYEKTFMPDENRHEEYMQIYDRIYREIYPALRPIYKKYLRVR